MAQFPNAIFTDSVGSSETGFQGTGMQDASALSTDGPVVSIGPNTAVISDEGHVLDPVADVGKVGRTARSGNVPVGYYKDPEKSARTFYEIDGVRYSVPGDFARIEEGNRITLLGRGSNCVNTGGEKVYPEEVEMAIKGHPAVYDVLVVGLPDEKYGQTVAAVVQPREGQKVELEELRTFLRAHLSGYKLPRVLTLVEEIPRNATGKAQYPAAKEMALSAQSAGTAQTSDARPRPTERTPDAHRPLRCLRHRVPDLRLHALRARRGRGLARRRARRARLRPVQRRRGPREGAGLDGRQHRRQAVRRRRGHADEDPHRGHVDRPVVVHPRGPQEVGRRDPAQAGRAAAAGRRGPGGSPRLAALDGALARRRRAAAPAGADRQRARHPAERRDRAVPRGGPQGRRPGRCAEARGEPRRQRRRHHRRPGLRGGRSHR